MNIMTAKKLNKSAKKSTESDIAIFSDSSKILVVGGGAVGGVIAGYIARSGRDIEVLTKSVDYAATLEHKGITIHAGVETFTVPMHAYNNVKKIKEKKDIIFLAVKSDDLTEALKEIEPLLKANTAVVSLQHGLHFDTMEKSVGLDRAYYALVGWGASLNDFGDLNFKKTGTIILGHKNFLKLDDEMQFLSSLLRPISSLSISRNIIASLYSRLILASCVNSLGALTGWTLGEMVHRKKVRHLFVEIIREGLALAESLHIPVERPLPFIRYEKIVAAHSSFARFKAHSAIRRLGIRHGAVVSSSLQSLERGQKSEIDFMNGAIATLSGTRGLFAPINERITEMVHEIESGKRAITPLNLQDTMFAPFGVL